jgi:hypothetical protein
MMMRYKIGLAVGHTYAHSQSPCVDKRVAEGSHQATRDDEELDSALPNSSPVTALVAESDSEDSSEGSHDDMDDRYDFSDDEEFLAMQEMYSLS